MKRFSSVLALGAFLFFCQALLAAVPQLINFQGILKDGSGNPVANGSYSVVFTIYDAPSGGTNLWSETQSVTTTRGLFGVNLGSVTPLGDTVFSSATRYLGIQVGADPEMTPRTVLVSVPYSHRTATVDGALGGNITGNLSISGRVGIGTTSPTRALDIHTNFSGDYLNFETSTSGPISLRLKSSTRDWFFVNGFAFNDRLSVFDQTASRERLVIDGPTGNVGIGTVSPAARLHVKGAGFPASFGYFDTDASSQDAGLRFYEAGTVKSHIFHEAGTNTLDLYGEGYSGISVTSTGSVGIGTTAPSGAKLDVRGNIKMGSSGQFFAIGGEENLKIIRGGVNLDGTVPLGSGFTVTHPSTGHYVITFTVPFSGSPATVVTPFVGGAVVLAAINNESSTSVTVVTSTLGTASDESFRFVAIGPR